MNGLEIIILFIGGFFLLVVPLLIAFGLHKKSRNELKLILGVYFLIAAFVYVSILSFVGLI